MSGDGRRRVEGADQVEQAGCGRQVGVDRGVQVLDAVEPQQFGLDRVVALKVLIAGEYSGSFRNSGEHVRLEAADDSPIADFSYGDSS
jgi:hypothetical protein